jgi:sugar (pentulose or hexulose) kinase
MGSTRGREEEREMEDGREEMVDEVQEQEEVQAQERREPSVVAGTVGRSAVELLRGNNGERSCVVGLLDHLFSFRAAPGETLGCEGLGVEMSRRRAEVVRRDERRGTGTSFAGGAEGESGAEGGGGAAADWLKLLFRLARPLLCIVGDIVNEESIAVLLPLLLLFTRWLRPAWLAGSLQAWLTFGISDVKAVHARTGGEKL